MGWLVGHRWAPHRQDSLGLERVDPDAMFYSYTLAGPGKRTEQFRVEESFPRAKTRRPDPPQGVSFLFLLNRDVSGQANRF